MNPYDEMLRGLDESGQGGRRAENPYLELFRARADAETRRLRQTTIEAEGESPERAAQVLRLSKAIGLPVDVVRRNFDTMRRRYDVESLPYGEVQQSPALAEYMAQGAAQTAVVRDDLEGLGFLEWVTRAPVRAFSRSVAQVALAQLRFESMWRELTADEQARLEGWQREIQSGGELGAGGSLARKAIVGGAGLLPMIGGSVLAGLERGIPFGVTAGSLAALAGQAGPQVAALEEVITVPVAFAGGMGAGMLTGAAEYGFVLEAGLAYDEYLEFRDEAGQPIDPAAAKAAALAAGAMASGLEAVGLGALLRSIPGAQKLMGAAARKSVAQALKNPTVRAALVDAVRAYGETVTAETAVEVAQRAATIVAGEWAKAVSGLETQGVGEIAGELGDEAIEAGLAFSLIPVPGAAVQAVRDVRAVQASRAQSAFFEALAAGVANSKTAQRMPEAVQEILARATRGGPVENIYVDAERWSTYWQEQGQDPAEVAAELTGSRDAYDEAVSTQGDLVIPTAAYAAKLAGTKHHAGLKVDLRLDPDGLSEREREVVLAEAERLAAEALEEAAGDGRDPGADIQQQIEAELVAAAVPPDVARKYAALDAAFFVRMAERAGVDPMALYERYGLRVQRVDESGTSGLATGVAAAVAGDAGGGVEINTPGRLLAAIDAEAAEPGPDGLIPVPLAVTPDQIASLRELGIVVDVDGPDGTFTGFRPEAVEQLRAEAESATVATDGVDADGAGARSREDVRSRLEEHVTAAEVRSAADRRRAARARSRGVADVPAAYAEHFAELLAAARADGFAGTDDQLATIYVEYLNDARQVVRDTAPDADDVTSGRELLKAISSYGGINIEKDKGFRGELASMWESVRRKSDKDVVVIRRGKAAGTTRRNTLKARSAGLPGIPGILVRDGGLTVDYMLTSLEQEPRWAAMFEGNAADFLEAVDSAIRAEQEEIDRKNDPDFKAPPDDVVLTLRDLFRVRVDDPAWWQQQITVDPETGQTTFLQADDGPTLEILDPDEATLNASGESAASLEALRRQRAMQARGEAFVVYDRAGQRRPLLGPDAVDYVVRAGETYGIEGPLGFRVLDDRGGRYPGRRVELNQADETFGLPVNDDGTVTVYHHTSPEAAAEIRRTGQLRSAAEPAVYVTSEARPGATGYGDAVVAIAVDPAVLQIDDEFPDGRRDFRIEVAEPGGTLAVRVLDQELDQAVTESPEFRAWFGDSKVVDEQGRPLVVVHATFDDFEVFDPDRSDLGAHFGTVEQAGEIAKREMTGERMIPVYLRIENPLRLRDDGSFSYAMVLPQLVELGIATKAEAEAIEREALKEGHGRRPLATKATRELIERAGYDGVVYFNREEGIAASVEERAEAAGVDDAEFARRFPDARDSWIAFKPDQIKSAIGNRGTFDPNNPSILEQSATPSTRRGFLRFGPDRQMNIGLTERANLSTFLHESGHLFLEVFGDIVDEVEKIDLAELTDDQRKLLADYGGLLEWLGVESRDAIGREQHEQFARAFEAYLLEGRAPSLSLREIFVSFRAWLLGVYRTLRGLNVELTPEVRATFDRMLATDEAIAEAKAQGQVEALFTAPDQAGMTAEEFAAYQDRVTAATRTERETLERRLLAEVQREREAEWRRRRAEIRAAVWADLSQRPVYQALAAIRKGTKPDGSPLVEGEEPTPLKLDKRDLVWRYGADFVKALPRPFIYTAGEGGVAVDTVAEMFGFSSGDELILAIREAPALDELVDRETDRRMLAEHGSMLLDGSLEEQARAAVSNEDRDHIIRQEIRVLRRLQRESRPAVEAALREAERERAYERRWFEAEARLRIAIAEGRKQHEIDRLRAELSAMRAEQRGGAARVREQLPDAATVREMAARRVAQMRVRDLRPQRFWSVARRNARKAVEAAARGEYMAAAGFKTAELINTALYREAVRVKDDVARKARRVAELGEKAAQQRLGLAGQSYLDQVNGILDRFSFVTVPQKSLDRRATLAKWIESQQAEGLPIDLPEELVDEARRVPYQELSVEMFLGVVDGLDQILHLAQMKNRLLKAQQERDLAEVRSTLVESIRAHYTGRKRTQDDPRDRSAAAERRRWIGGMFASHRKMASLARQMDGGKDGGPMWEYVIRPLNEAGDREATMNAEAAEKLSRLFEAAFPGREMADLYTRTFVPAVGRSLSRMERIAIALNWGNEGNRDRIRRGEKWTDRQVEAVLDLLTESEWRFVQGVWDFLGSYWPEIEAKQRRVTGIAPEAVIPVPYTTRYGFTVTGGYYPLKYDERLSASAAANTEVSAAMAQLQAAYVQATTRRGHTEARRATVSMPVRLDFGVIFEHVGQVIHDLTHHEALIDVGRVLSKEVKQTILETYGDVVYKQFTAGIRDVAFGDVPARTEVEAALNYLRKGATVAALGWNLVTSFLQPLGLTQSMQRIGVRWVGRGLLRWLRGAAAMEATGEWIYERSAFMRNRGRTMQREINEIRNTIIDRTGAVSGWVDEILRRSTLNTVTKAGIADSYFYLIQQMQKVADFPTWLGAYERAMAAGETEARAVALADQAVIDSQGGGQIKDLAAVQRGGPMLKLWTNFYSFFNTTYNLTAESMARVSLKDPASLGRFAVDFLLLYTIPATLSHLLSEALRPEDDDDESLWVGLARANASYMLGVMLGVREVSGAVQGFYGYEGPAGARAFAALSRFAKQASQGEFDRAFFRSLNDVGGVVFHYPSGQVWRTATGVAAIAQGKTRNPAALVFGGPRE